MRKLRMTFALGFIFVSVAAFGSVARTDARNARPAAQGSLVDGIQADIDGDGFVFQTRTDVFEAPGVCPQDGSAAGAANQTLDDSTGWDALSDPTREVQRATVLAPCPRGTVTICERRCGSCQVLPGECCYTVCFCVEIGVIVRK